MVDYTTIRNTLVRIEAEYSSYMSTADPYMPQLLSKLAVLEFCGWIEESIDEILYNYLDNHIVDDNGRNIIKKFINNIHGFSFTDHMFRGFSLVIGANNLENILDELTPVDRGNLESILAAYHKERNEAAHKNTIIGVTRNFKSPSQVLTDFNKIESAIHTIERKVCRL